MKKSFLAAGLLAAAFLTAAFTSTSALERAPITQLFAVDGASVYAAYCSDCHGVSGRGDGRAAALLSRPVPDLASLCLRPGGFDASAVAHDVALSPLGSEPMPHWEALLQATYGDRARRLVILSNLVDHLETLQLLSTVVAEPDGPHVRLAAVPRLDPRDGGAVYASYCSGCHGAAGAGNGRLVARLGIRPADLTTWRSDTGGFDRAAFKNALGERHMLPTADGKTWNQVLATTYGTLAHERVLLDNLAAYVETLQSPR